MIPFFKLFGIRTYIDLSFLLFFGTIVGLTFAFSGAASGVAMILVVAALFVFVIMHEYGHAVAAQRLGLRPERITMTMFGGIMSFSSDMQMTPRQEFWMTIAGPAVTAALAALFYGWASLIETKEIKELVQALGRINLYLLIFNAIPAFPMDGGRILRSALAMIADYVRATTVAVWIGRFCCVGFVAYGIYSGSFMLCVIALFVWLAGTAELKMVRQQYGYARS